MWTSDTLFCVINSPAALTDYRHISVAAAATSALPCLALPEPGVAQVTWAGKICWCKISRHELVINVNFGRAKRGVSLPLGFLLVKMEGKENGDGRAAENSNEVKSK